MRKILASLLLAAATLFWVPTSALAQFSGTIRQSSTFTASGVTSGMATGNTATVFNMGLFQLYWRGTGTRTTCTVSVESSATLTGTYATVGAAQTCTADGSYSIWVQPAAANAYVRINLSAITGASNTVHIIMLGFSFTPTAPALALGNIQGFKQVIIPTAATIAPTIAQCGSMILMGATGGSVVTLPVPVVGCTYDITITVTNTSASNEVQTDSSATFLLGSVAHSASGIAALTFWANGTTIQAIKMNGTTTGGAIGSNFHLAAVSATQWEISGTNEGTATMTTAFTATP